MKIFKKFMQMTLLLFASFTLHIIPWIPSLLVENIVNSIIVILYILSAFLVYQIISIIFHRTIEKKIYKNALYTFLLLLYIGFFAILQIGVSYAKNSYINTYIFGEKTFYVYYDNNIRYEVSLKDKHLPIRTLPILDNAYTLVTLEQRDRYVYAIGKGINEKIYDLQEDTPLSVSK
jgi:hypothetical protein